MSEIKITFGGTEYELEYDPFRIKEATMEFVINGARYIGKEIQKEKGIPKEFDYDVLCWECKDGKDAYKRPSTVKRLSDNETFNISDTTNKGKIYRFEIRNGELLVGIENSATMHYLNHIEKVKPKEKDIPKDLGYEIFVLEDKKITGVVRLSDNQIFEVGDEVKWRWLVSPKEYVTIEGFYLDEEKRLIVKFKDWGAADQLFHIIMYMGFEKADEYILLNKSVPVSYKEIDKLFESTLGYNNFNKIIKDFFKSKIKCQT